MWLAELSVYEFEREMSDNIIIITNSDELISWAAAALPSTVCLLLAIGFKPRLHQFMLRVVQKF